MNCLAKNSRNQRCGHKAKFWKFGFCGSDHTFYSSNWFMLGNHQWIKWLIYPITFVASVILIFEIEDRWSTFRKGSPQIETPTEIPTKNDKELFDYSKLDNQFKVLNCCVGYFKLGSQIRYPETSDNYKIRKEIQTRMTEEGPEEENTFTVSILSLIHI